MRKLIFSLIATLMLPLVMSAQAYTQSKSYNPQTGHLDYNENRPSRMYEAGKRYYGLRIGPSFSVVNSDDKALDGGKWQTGLNIGAVVGQPLTDSAPLFIPFPFAVSTGQLRYTRRLIADGNWQTLCLPFDADAVEGQGQFEAGKALGMDGEALAFGETQTVSGGAAQFFGAKPT